MSYLFSNTNPLYTNRFVKFIEHSSQPLKYRTDKKWLLEKCFKQYRTTFAEYLALIELLIFSVLLQSIICCWCLTWLETIKREFSFQLNSFFFLFHLILLIDQQALPFESHAHQCTSLHSHWKEKNQVLTNKQKS